MPVAPSERLVEIGAAGPQGRKCLAQHVPGGFGVLKGCLKVGFQVGPGPAELVDGVVHSLDRHGADPRQMQPPPDMLLHNHLLPRWVAEQAVEAGTVAHEDLGEMSGEMQRDQSTDRVAHCCRLAQADKDFLVEVLGQVACSGSMGGDHVERGPGARHCRGHIEVQGSGLVDLPLGRVRDACSALQRRNGLAQQAQYQLAGQARPVRIGLGLERGDNLVECAHTGEAVAVHQVVVQQRQR